MRELALILEAIGQELGQGRSVVLATLVRTAGSTYRRPGARMLWREDGSALGLLSGGCLEPDLAQRANEVLRSGDTKTLTYDLRSPDDIVWGLGLGCSGELRVLLERLDPRRPPEYLAFLRACLERRHNGILATVSAVDGAPVARVGERATIRGDGRPVQSLSDPALTSALLDHAGACLARRATAVVAQEIAGARVEILVEHIVPPVGLVVFGAGADAQPLVRIAGELGWRVTVADVRPGFALRDRFPAAHAVVLCDPQLPHAALPPIDEYTAVVILSHHYLHDRAILAHALGTPTPYIGLLGPRRRAESLQREAAAVAPDGEPSRVHGPAGIDIGSEAPAEIALSIVAEIQAVLARRRGGFLRDRAGPLHDPAAGSS